jgi:hypothetical protein
MEKVKKKADDPCLHADQQLLYFFALRQAAAARPDGIPFFSKNAAFSLENTVFL